MDDNTIKTWPQWLQENDPTHTLGNCKCVLVQNIPNEVAMEKVKLYFENKKRSGGGNIRTIAKLVDGVLIIYKDDRCVENVLKKDQILNGARLKLFARTIPALCRDRFLLQNVGSDTALDTVEMLLENCDMPKHRCPNLIQSKMEGQYLAVYDEDIELPEVSSVAQKVSGQALEGHNLQVNLLYPSNALLVEDIPNGNPKEHIKEFFENLNNCSDINVTMVEMCSSNTAVVSFAECQHAENVVRLHNDANLKIDGCCLKVSLYYPDLFMENTDFMGDSSDEFQEQDHETSIVQSGNNKQPNHGKYTIPHGHAILGFLDFNVLRKSIQSEFSHCAKLTLSVGDETMYIQYSHLKNVEPLTLLGSFEEFFSKYGSEFVTAKQDDIFELRLSNGWKEDEEIIEIKVGSKKVKVSAKWSGNQVQITGNKEDVDIAVKELIRLFNTTSETLVLNKFNLRMFMRSGCSNDFATDVLKVECNESDSSVTFTGAEQDVKQAKQDLAFKLLSMEQNTVETKSVQVQIATRSVQVQVEELGKGIKQTQTDLTNVISLSTQTNSKAKKHKLVQTKVFSFKPISSDAKTQTDRTERKNTAVQTSIELKNVLTQGQKNWNKSSRNPQNHIPSVGTLSKEGHTVATGATAVVSSEKSYQTSKDGQKQKAKWEMTHDLMPVSKFYRNATHRLYFNIPAPNNECASFKNKAYIPVGPNALGIINRIQKLVIAKKLFQVERDSVFGLMYQCKLKCLAFNPNDIKKNYTEILMNEVKQLEKNSKDADNVKEKFAICAICLDGLNGGHKVKLLPCTHQFHKICVEQALKVSNICPICKQPVGQLKGNQPDGTMTHRVDRYCHLPGYESYGAIVIQYKFQSGVQRPEHPNPGVRYQGTSRTAYLPDNSEGREILRLLRRAFDARLTFTVGRSVATGMDNQIIWNDIHHKTNIHGCSSEYGYPDPGYFTRIKDELRAKGIQ